MGFKQFENFEQMQQWMADRTTEANQDLAPEQQQLTYGDHWVRFTYLTDFGLIFGHVFTKAEWLASEMAAGADDDEANYSLKLVEASHERGYMHGPAYSVVTPGGEYGDTHRADIWPIDETLFAEVEAAGWDLNRMEQGTKIKLAIIFEEWRQHETELIAAARLKLAEERDSL